MKTRAFLAVAVLATLILAGCSLARQATTKRLDFTQNLIPTRNHGSTYATGLSDTNGPIGPLPFDIQITGDVRDRYDKYHGGVDYAYLTYQAHAASPYPVRMRLWASLARNLDQCAPIENNQVPADAQLILDETIPPNGDVNTLNASPHNVEELRRIVEALLQQPNNAAACVYVQASCVDNAGNVYPSGNVVVSDLNVVGRAHGSLF